MQETISNDDPDSNELPFNLFDESIPLNKLKEVIRFRLARPKFKAGTFNIYNPEDEFQKLYTQAGATTHNLVGSAADVNEVIEKLPKAKDKSYEEFLRVIYRLLGTITDPALASFLKDASEMELEEKIPFLKCMDIVHHIWGTSYMKIMSTMRRYDIYAINEFNKFFIKATFSIYNDGRKTPEYAIRGTVARTFVNYVHINILDKSLLNNPDLDLDKCIDLYVNQNFSSINNIQELETNILYIRQNIMMEHENHDVNKSYLLEMVVQTITWYLLTNIKANKFLGFKGNTRITLKKILDCYNESLLESINEFLDKIGVEG